MTRNDEYLPYDARDHALRAAYLLQQHDERINYIRDAIAHALVAIAMRITQEAP